jgi:PERQ amino acid-rich with GYF domain-containing protein
MRIRISKQIAEPANSEHIVKNDQTTTMQPKPIQQLKANEDIQNIIQQCIPPTNTLAEPAVQPSQQLSDKWFYLDPSAVQRGPFDTQQMQAWFSSGYFTASLQVRRTCDSRYITLG